MAIVFTTPDLQAVTDAGFLTTNSILATKLTTVADAYKDGLKGVAWHIPGGAAGNISGVYGQGILDGSTAYTTGYAYGGFFTSTYQASVNAAAAGGVDGINVTSSATTAFTVPTVRGISVLSTTSAASTITNLVGGAITTTASAAAAITNVTGLQVGIGFTSSPTVGTLIDLKLIRLGSGSGAITDAYGIKFSDFTSGVDPTNNYGLFIPALTKGTNKYPILLGTDAKLHLRESGTSVHSSASGQLDLTAATTVKINTAQLVLPNYSLPLADGTANYFLQTDGAGVVGWAAGGSGSPGGANTELQYNNAGAFGGMSTATFDGTAITYSGTMQTIYQDNVEAVFGTGSDATISYDGTDLIIDSLAVGTGVTKFGSAMGGDIRLNKIGLGATAISSSFFINLVTSGNARGGMQFDYTATGTNPLIDLFMKCTSQHTNVSPNTGGAQASVFKNEDSSLGYGTTAPTYFGFYAVLGTTSTSTITAGDQRFYGFRADMTANGRGTANTGGNILTYGLKIEDTLAYTGVASQVDYGVFSEEDIGVIAGIKYGFNDTATAKGTTYMSYVSADTELKTYVNNIQTTGQRSTKVDFYQPPQRMGMSKGVIVASMNGWGA